MPIPVNRPLNPRQLEQLKKVSPTTAEILDNVDALNEEIEESFPGQVVSLPKPEAPVPSMDDELALITRKAQAKLAAKHAEATKQEAETAKKTEPAPAPPVEETMEDKVKNVLRSLPKAPSEAQIEAWKKEHGSTGVFVTAFSEKEAYVYTYIRRGQWIKLKEALAKAVEAEMVQDQENWTREKIVSYGVLWPRPLDEKFFYNSRAGTIDTLYQMIMLQSHFLQPAQAMNLTAQL